MTRTPEVNERESADIGKNNPSKENCGSSDSANAFGTASCGSSDSANAFGTASRDSSDATNGGHSSDAANGGGSSDSANAFGTASCDSSDAANKSGSASAVSVQSRLFRLCGLPAAALCGLLGGGACVLFYACTQVCDQARIHHELLLYLLPLAGLLIVFLYDGVLGEQDLSLGSLFRHAQEGKPVSLWIAPMIFLSTCLAYLTGGSVGRAGSALQIGGSIAANLRQRNSRHEATSTDTAPNLRQRNSRHEATNSATASNPEHLIARSEGRFEDNLLIACGMSAGFTAVLNSPLAGAVFGVEILVFSRYSRRLILPALLSSFITWGIALGARRLLAGPAFALSYMDLSVPAWHFDALTPEGFLRIAALGLASVLIARLYCYSRRFVAWGMARLLRDPYLRVLAGTALVVVITRLLGTMDYNGVGFSYVATALGGSCAGLAFLWKLVLTVLTLGCGIRGGQIAPNVFIGATFGCAAAPLIGLDPCVGAAVCLVGVLSSVTNCTAAIFLYGCETLCFCPKAGLAFLIASAFAHVLSSEIGIFREQPTERIRWKLHIW